MDMVPVSQDFAYHDSYLFASNWRNCIPIMASEPLTLPNEKCLIDNNYRDQFMIGLMNFDW